MNKIIHSRMFTHKHSGTPFNKCNMHTSTPPWLQPKRPGTPDNVGMVLLAAWALFYLTNQSIVTWHVGKHRSI